MNDKRLTLQKTLAITILLIGAIGIVLVVITDFTYRKIAFEQQTQSINQLITIKSVHQLEKLSTHQKELGIQLLNNARFKTALEANDKMTLQDLMDKALNIAYLQAGSFKLEKILLYDNNFQLLASTSGGFEITPEKNLLCPGIASNGNTQNVSPPSQLCEHNQQILLSTVTTKQYDNTRVYIQLLAAPLQALIQIENELGVPLKIYSKNNTLLHQSINWPSASDTQKYLISSYPLPDAQNNIAVKIESASDITVFKSHMDSTRYKIIIGASALTLITLLFAFIILYHGLLPLTNLRRAANSSARGEFTSISETGYHEISAPIHAFNLMVIKIQSLINDLKTEVYDHKITEEKYKQAKETAEQQTHHAEQQNNFLHMTLQSIVDGVITTSIDGYIKSVNPVAEQLTGWTETEAKGKPLIQVMHALKEDTHKRIYNPTENIEHKTVLDEPISAVLIQNHTEIETPVEYVVAPMRDHEDKIAGIVIIIHDESVQRSLNRQLTFQATHDALTGLINRYEFERRLKNIISKQTIEGSINTLCYIDLDRFKLVNDTCGHKAGDELLKQITRLLQNSLNGAGTLARIGGDEFSLLLEHTDVTAAQDIATRLLEAIRAYRFDWNENTFTIGASIGITSIASDTLSCEKILSNADSACYLAKEGGRNRTQIYTEEDDKLLTQQREMHWVSRINHALEENRFQLYFQEIMPLQGHKQNFIKHGEILLRMIDKEGNIVSPNSFLPAAERYNMITLIDEWVVDKSIQWLSTRKEKVLISVNLSGVSLSNHDFLNFVVSKIKQQNINPELLCFEVTETAAINNLNTAIHFMNVLKKLGCSFALDDFGSGLSSFSYLNSLPVDYLKIDGAFVMDIDKDPMHHAMVKSINEVGQVMGIKTIAEFATSKNIIRCLREVGVDYAQGYAIARPVPLSVLTIESQATLSAVKNDQSVN